MGFTRYGDLIQAPLAVSTMDYHHVPATQALQYTGQDTNEIRVKHS